MKEAAGAAAGYGARSGIRERGRFKFGSIVRPGHRGIWEEPLRTGKYAINPRIDQAEMVPTAILTLNWAEAASQAHNLDKQLKQIVAKSKEAFIFNIDLQVQIHVSDRLAPEVISMVGTIQNLVNEVLQAVVGTIFETRAAGVCLASDKADVLMDVTIASVGTTRRVVCAGFGRCHTISASGVIGRGRQRTH